MYNLIFIISLTFLIGTFVFAGTTDASIETYQTGSDFQGADFTVIEEVTACSLLVDRIEITFMRIDDFYTDMFLAKEIRPPRLRSQDLSSTNHYLKDQVALLIADRHGLRKARDGLTQG
jgi:hypothetical protein